jgi:UDPglucose--hexose-1-phosphate uridylyltransferase
LTAGSRTTPPTAAKATATSVDALATRPHRRYNPLLDEWVLVSADRNRRPSVGRREGPPASNPPAYDPTCYLCPGNRRVNGAVNPDFAETFVFTNDFAALRPDVPPGVVDEGLLQAEVEPGTCRVIVFARRHDLTLAAMSTADVRRVVDLWADQTAELGERYQWVQVFENRGEMLLDYVAQEAGGSRVVVENEDWLAVVPFWASWPYETLLIARAAARRLPELDDRRRDSLSDILIRLLRAYDRLFDLSFPYSMGWHQAPFGDGDVAHWQLHAHFLPPLLTASARKFMVGYELLAETQRDLTPEQAAQRLRDALNGDGAGAEAEADSPADDRSASMDGTAGRDGAGPAP